MDPSTNHRLSFLDDDVENERIKVLLLVLTLFKNAYFLSFLNGSFPGVYSPIAKPVVKMTVSKNVYRMLILS